MEVAVTHHERLGPLLFRVHWDNSGGGTFYVWADGALVGTTTEGFWDLTVGIGRQLAVWIFDDAADAPGEWFPGSVLLLWQGETGATAYRVEGWDGEGWEVLSQILADARGVYHWDSGLLPDETAYQFRVVGVDAQARDGEAREFAGTMCRYPDPPSAAVAWAAGEFLITV